MISDLATGRPANPFERAMYAAAAHDERVFEAFDSRSASQVARLRLRSAGARAGRARRKNSLIAGF
jgi:hypothetical protein